MPFPSHAHYISRGQTEKARTIKNRVWTTLAPAVNPTMDSYCSSIDGTPVPRTPPFFGKSTRSVSTPQKYECAVGASHSVILFERSLSSNTHKKIHTPLSLIIATTTTTTIILLLFLVAISLSPSSSSSSYHHHHHHRHHSNHRHHRQHPSCPPSPSITLSFMRHISAAFSPSPCKARSKHKQMPMQQQLLIAVRQLP